MADLTDHDRLRDLLGAYALDAIEATELEHVEAHLTTCEACQTVVDDLREVAGWLGTTDVPPPDHLWDEIAGQLGVEPPSAITTLDAARRNRRTRPVVQLAIAAVVLLLVGIASLGLLATHQKSQLDRANRQLSGTGAESPLAIAADRAATQPGVRRIALRGTKGDAYASVIVQRDGSAYFVPTASMSPLDQKHTYQLWGVAGTQVVSLGVLGAQPGVTKIEVPAGIKALAVTEEVSTGVVASTQKPVAQATVA